MSTAIPSLIFSLGVCLNLYLILDRLKMAIACKTGSKNKAKFMFQFILWVSAVAYLVFHATVSRVPLHAFSAELFFFAFVFSFGIHNSINKHQIKG